MKLIQRCLCLLLCLALLPAVSLAQEEEAAAPTIRVLLRRLGLTSRADLTLDGVYTAAMGGEMMMAFPKGSEVVIEIREGEMYLFYAGMSLRVGEELTLVRNASEKSAGEGIRFTKGGNYYPGNLRLTIADGVLQPVLTIGVEDYLLGVVPYEMGESAPLEALKAQAVCARTYALAHVNPSAAYDVVDTTNDQVFKGVDPTLTNSARAIRETAGVVGFHQGALATCYYSASNGGQTELVENVWGGRNAPSYYRMVDDPYDLEHPESVVRRARLGKTAPALRSKFVALLAGAIKKEMISHGFDASADCLRVDSIAAVTLGKPKHAAPSRMMTEVTLTFTWSGRKLLTPAATVTPRPTPEDEEISLFSTPSPTPTAAPTVDSLFTEPTTAPTPIPTPVYSEYTVVAEPVTVTLQLFPDVCDVLGLSINATDNEIITVSETPDDFVLEARRFGHGVGMSQRGAQWMAGTYGKQYHEILAFYYPGMELRKAPAGVIPLPTAPAALADSPAPPATPTPRPTLMPVTVPLPEGAYMATVAHIDDDSSLNLRAEPSMSAEILMRLYKHQQLIVLGPGEDPEWVHVRTDVAEGYVMLSYLERVTE